MSQVHLQTDEAVVIDCRVRFLDSDLVLGALLYMWRRCDVSCPHQPGKALEGFCCQPPSRYPPKPVTAQYLPRNKETVRLPNHCTDALTHCHKMPVRQQFPAPSFLPAGRCGL